MLRVADSLVFCHTADQAFAVLKDAHYAGRCAFSFRAGDDDRLSAFHHCHRAEGGA